MATSNSIPKNPHFQNIDSPFTGLFELLTKMYSHVYPSSLTYTEDNDVLKAICQHAENGLHAIFYTLPSLGALLAGAADNKDMGISEKDISFIGWLIQLLADLLIACYTTESNVRDELIKRGVTVL